MSDIVRISDSEIIGAYRKHYASTFARHGATSRGVDWGQLSDVQIRYGKMLEVIQTQQIGERRPTILDVGCGYGGLLEFAKEAEIAIDYVGIDIVPEMIECAHAKHPEAKFIVGDILSMQDLPGIDYAVCNGILTLKLEASILDMDRFARRLVQKMFSVARCGVAFNMMTTMVNFTAPNLYYKSPLETLAFCSQLSRRFKLDHAYPLYEYTLYLYRDDSGTPASGAGA